jgi:hypothetical protein
MPALSYRQVLEQHDRSGDPRPLPEYAKAMNELYGNDMFSEGERDGWWTRASTRADQFLENSVAGDVLGGVGGFVGGMFGREEQGADIGRKSVRSIANLAPLLIPGIGQIGGAAALAGTFGAHTYAETGSPRAAAISGVTAALMPALGHVGGTLGLRAAGAPLARGLLTDVGETSGLFGRAVAGDFVSQRIATSPGEFAGQYLGSQTAQFGTMAASAKLQNPDQDVLSKDFATEFLLGQIPFTAMDVVHATRALGKRTVLAPDGTKTVVDGLPTQEQVGLMTTPEQKPASAAKPLVPSAGTAEEAANLHDLLQAHETIANDPTRTAAEKSAALANLTRAVANPKEVSSAQGTGDLVRVKGYTRGDGRILVEDIPDTAGVAVPEHGTMLAWPKDMKDVEVDSDGNIEFSVPASKLKPANVGITRPKGRGEVVDPLQPELPPAPPRKFAHYLEGPITETQYGRQLDVHDAFAMLRKGQPWTPEETATAVEMGVPEHTALRISQRLPKSGDPILNSIRGGINLDPEGRVVRMGNTDIGLEGRMNERAFLKRTQMPKEFLEAAREMYPEAFGEKGVVNVNVLVKALQERPMVETRRLDAFVGGEKEKARLETEQIKAELQHKLDTAGVTFNSDGTATYRGQIFDPNKFEDRIRVLQDPHLQGDVGDYAHILNNPETEDFTESSSESATARFSSVNPYPPEVLRGEKEVAPGHRITWAGDLTGQIPIEKLPTYGAEKEAWGQPQPKFQSQHYPSDAGKNQLFFVRGALHEYAPGAKLPDGTVETKATKIFEVWEVQSDWAGEMSRKKERAEKELPLNKAELEQLKQQEPFYSPAAIGWRYNGEFFPDEMVGGGKMAVERAKARYIKKYEDIIAKDEAILRGEDEQNTSLLPKWEPLALTSAVQQARALGADAIALSDAESAMMTEGHDKAGVREGTLKAETKDEAIAQFRLKHPTAIINKVETDFYGGSQKYVVNFTEVSQSPGMTAAYDVRGPKTLEKLTGVKGKRVVMGEVHQNVGEDAGNVYPPQSKEKADADAKFWGRGAYVKKIGEGGSEGWWQVVKPKGSPVFKEGPEAKVTNTARLFSLEKISGGLSIDDTLSIKEAVHAYDMAKQREGEARALAAKQKSPEELAQHAEKERVEAHLAKGLSPTQATESAALETITKEVDAALTEQEVQRALVQSKTAARFEGKERTQFTGEVVVPNEKGEHTVFASRPEALEWLAENRPERDPDDFAIIDAGKNAAGERKGFTVREKANRKISLDLPDAGGHERVGEQALQDVEELARSETPSVSPITDDVAHTNLADALRQWTAVSYKNSTGADIADALKVVNGAKKALAAVEKGEAAQPADLANLQKLTKEHLRRRSFALGSEVPHDSVLVAEMNILENPANGLEWFAKTFPSGFMSGVYRDLLDLARNSLNQIRWTNDFRGGFYYHEAEKSDSGAPEINIPHLPTSRAHAEAWVMNLAHEIVHHVTKDLDARGDAAAVEFRKSVEEIRKQLETSKLIPLPVRKVIARARNEGWLKEWYNAQPGDQTIGDRFIEAVGKRHQNWLGVFYGLLDHHEFLSAAFSDRNFAGLLAGTERPLPSGLKERVLDWFSRTWAKLTQSRAMPENALAEVIGRFEDYLGKPQGYNTMDFIRDRLISHGVRPEALASRVLAVKNMLKTGGLEESVEAWKREAGANLLPATAQYADPAFTLEQTPLAIGKTILALPPEAVPAQRDLWLRLHQDTEVARDVVKNADAEMPPELMKSVAKVAMLGKAIRQYERAQERFSYVDNFDGGDTWRDRIVGRLRNVDPVAPADPPANLDLAQSLMGLAEPMIPLESAAEVRGRTSEGLLKQGKFARLKSFLEKNFLLDQHFSKLYPAHAARHDALQKAQGDAFAFAQELAVAYNYDKDTKRPSDRITKNNMEVRDTPRLAEPVSDALRLANVLEQGGQPAPWLHKDIQALVAHLSSGEREKVRLTFEAVKHRNYINTEIVWPEYFRKVIPKEVGLTIAAREGVLPESAEAVAKDFYETLTALRVPETANAAVAKLQALATTLSPATTAKVIDQTNAAIKFAEEHIAFLKTRPTNTSEQRYGKKQAVLFDSKGKPTRVSADSWDELQGLVRKKEAAGFRVGFVDEKESGQFEGMNESAIAKLQDLEVQQQQRRAAALQGAPPDVAADLLSQDTLSQELKDSLVAATPLPGVRRKFAAGRETLNMLEQGDTAFGRQSNWMRHKLARAGDALARMAPEVAGNLELKKFGDQKLEAFLTPDSEWARKLTSATFFYKLAFEFGNTFLEGFQHLTTGMQQLVSETGSVGDAGALVAKASKDLWRAMTTKKWASQEQADFMRWAAEHGHDQASTWNDIHDPDTMSLRMANSAKGVVGRGIEGVDIVSKKLSGTVQGYGNRIGLLAAFAFARERGMAFNAAADYAVQSKNLGMYTGGKAQRSGLWRIKTKAVPQLLTSLQTYTQGWFGQMYSDYVRGFSKDRPSGLSKAQIEGSKKAFLYGVAAQATLAGALGLPGVGQGMALIQQASGLDLKGWTRGHLQQLFDEDQESGGLISGVAMNGILAGVTPFDPSNRASISIPFIGVSTQKGFDMGQLAGAPVATAGDFAKGLLSAASGQRVGWETALPNVLRRPARLAADDWDVRDRRGGLLYSLSPAERAMTLLGLPPSRIQRARDVAQAAKNASDAVTAQKEQMADSLARLFTEKGPEAVGLRLQQLKAENPEVDLRSLVKAIATRRVRQITPYDWRRETNPGAELAGLGVYNPSTVALGRQIQTGTEQALGLRERPNPRADIEAVAVDHLLNTGVVKTEAEARKLLQQGRRRPQPALQIPGL